MNFTDDAFQRVGAGVEVERRVGVWVGVGVTVGVAVGVGVMVGVLVGVIVGVLVGVFVGDHGVPVGGAAPAWSRAARSLSLLAPAPGAIVAVIDGPDETLAHTAAGIGALCAVSPPTAASTFSAPQNNSSATTTMASTTEP